MQDAGFFSHHPPMASEGRDVAYHRNPSAQRLIKLIFLPVVGLEDEFAVELGEGDAGVGVEFRAVVREAGRARSVGGRWRPVSLLHCLSCKVRWEFSGRRTLGVVWCGAVSCRVVSGAVAGVWERGRWMLVEDLLG